MAKIFIFLGVLLLFLIIMIAWMLLFTIISSRWNDKYHNLHSIIFLL